MKLKVVMINEDTIYNERLSDYAKKYMAEEFQVLTGDTETAGAGIALISETAYRQGGCPGNLFPVVLCEVEDVEKVDGCPAVFRYRPADEILRETRRIFLEQNRYETGAGKGDGGMQTVSFLSPAGGVGTSTIALSLAIHAAQQGKRVIFLDLAQFSGLGAVIRPVQQNLSEVIFALKMKKNLNLRLKELLREDVSGIRYFGITARLQDMNELTAEDITLLVQTLKAGQFCDLLVIDADCRVDASCETLLHMSDRVLLVSDGSEIANLKVMRYAVALHQDKRKEPVSGISLIYNRFGSADGEKLKLPWLPEFGGFPRVKEAGQRMIAEQFSKNPIWDHI